ncbi:hypothetical protein CROQUDRAFT_661506 [Cronartium quercuum f. sp. fusiforme G11]|uniref:PEBP-like protein n=1 Tax=Cronartium quercuum f. sp. fusiforme G11 TaxID=708437 RepID=A0A9P6T8Q7_9BASI|nr:hypothetical protein CROQUDRAFT_661506 [Cronartium quercuum f. sp. fusiforme G11]
MSTFAFKPTHTFILLVSAYLFASTRAQATAQQLAIVQAEYDASQFSANYPDGFGIPLKAQALLNVIYPSGNVQLAKPYSASDVSTLPTISVTPSASNEANFKAPNVFTLTLADANALGNPDPQGNYRHFLENGASFGDPTSNGTSALNSGSGTLVTPYAGPGPLPNEGPHRYAWLLFAQPSGFHAPSNLSTASVGPGHWYLNSYVSSSGLGDLVAASFFTVENGHASYSLKPTAALNTATITAQPTGGSGSSTGAGAVITAAPNSTSTNARNPANSLHPTSIDLFKTFFMGFGLIFVGFLLVQ